MKTTFDQRATTATSISTESFNTLPIFTDLYWRVRSCGASKADGESEIRKMSVTNLLITAPAHQSTDMILTPTFEYSIPDRDVTLEIALENDFADKNMVYTVDGRGAITVPRFVLKAAHTYHARMRYVRAGVELSTPVITFTTVEMEPTVPTIAWPLNGGVLHADERIRLNDVEGCTILAIQLAASDTYPARSSYTSSNVDLMTMEDNKDASEIKISSKNLVDGQTYYVHAQSTYRDLNQKSLKSEYGPTVAFTYSAEPAGIATVDAEGNIALEGRTLHVFADTKAIVLYDLAGAEVAHVADSASAGQSFTLDVTPGIYLIKTATANENIILKAVVK